MTDIRESAARIRSLLRGKHHTTETAQDTNSLVSSFTQRIGTWRQALAVSNFDHHQFVNRGNVSVLQTDTGLTPREFSATLTSQPNYAYTLSYRVYPRGENTHDVTVEILDNQLLKDPQTGKRIQSIQVSLVDATLGSKYPKGTRILTVEETCHEESSLLYTHSIVSYVLKPGRKNVEKKYKNRPKIALINEERMTDEKALQMFDLVDSVLFRGNGNVIPESSRRGI